MYIHKQPQSSIETGIGDGDRDGMTEMYVIGNGLHGGVYLMKASKLFFSASSSSVIFVFVQLL